MLRILTCLPGLLLITAIATAADVFEVPKRYEVELIVFRHTDQTRNTPEIPAASALFNPSPLDLILAEPPVQAPANEPVQSPQMLAAPDELLDSAAILRNRQPPITFLIMDLNPTYPDFVPLRDDTQTLDRVYQRLERIDAYEPLLHIGWVQPARDSDGAKPYRFEPTTIGEIGIVGTVTLYKERFLHLEIDLALEADKPAIEARYLFPADAIDTPDEYTLMESRRIRGSATHYFDHPQFGIIARVQEVEAAAAEREGTG